MANDGWAAPPEPPAATGAAGAKPSARTVTVPMPVASSRVKSTSVTRETPVHCVTPLSSHWSSAFQRPTGAPPP